MTWTTPTAPNVLRHVGRATCVGGPADGSVLPITAGQVTVDYGSDVRRSGSVTVAATPEWVPDGETDPLDPRAGTELLIELWDSGTQSWVPEGLFSISKPRTNRSISGVQVTVDVVDRSGRARLAGMDRRWVIPAGTLASDAIRSILTQVAPWLPCIFPDTTDIMQTDVLLEFGDDPWAACIDIAQSVGLDIFCDTTGHVVTADATAALSAQATPVQWVTIDRDIDAAAVVNHVRAEWTPARPDPLPKDWSDAGGYEDAVDEDSSTGVLSWVGRRCRMVNGDRSLLTSANAAKQAAAIELLKRMDVTYSGSGTVVPNPLLDVGTVVELDGDRYRITRLTIDLAGAATDVTLGVPPVRLAALMARALTIPGDRRTREIVVALNPLRTARAAAPGGSWLTVTPTAAVDGVVVGDVVEVLHTGRGERIAVSRFLSGSAYAAEVMADNPFCYFPLDETTGTPVDAMGNVTPSSMPGVTLGGVGVGDGAHAASVDGATGSGVVLPQASFNGVTNFTVEILAKPTDLAAQRYIAGMDGTTTQLAFLLQIAATSGQITGFTGAGWANTIGSAYSDPAPLARHHWAITWDGTTAVLYRDGVQIASEAQSWSPSNPALDMYIGGRRPTSDGFYGQVGGFAFYKSALPASRILAHAQAAGL